jgi:hypothetical protein
MWGKFTRNYFVVSQRIIYHTNQTALTLLLQDFAKTGLTLLHVLIKLG